MRVSLPGVWHPESQPPCIVYKTRVVNAHFFEHLYWNSRSLGGFDCYKRFVEILLDGLFKLKNCSILQKKIVLKYNENFSKFQPVIMQNAKKLRKFVMRIAKRR